MVLVNGHLWHSCPLRSIRCRALCPPWWTAPCSGTWLGLANGRQLPDIREWTGGGVFPALPAGLQSRHWLSTPRCSLPAPASTGNPKFSASSSSPRGGSFPQLLPSGCSLTGAASVSPFSPTSYPDPWGYLLSSAGTLTDTDMIFATF